MKIKDFVKEVESQFLELNNSILPVHFSGYIKLIAKIIGFLKAIEELDD
jgi:hypothetical protein